MRKCVDVVGSQSFHYGKKTHRYEMLRGRREPFGKGLELEVLVQTQDFMGFPCGSAGKESAHNAGDLGLIPGLGGSPGEGKGYPLQYSGLENSVDRIVHQLQRVGHD